MHDKQHKEGDKKVQMEEKVFLGVWLGSMHVHLNTGFRQ